MAHHYFERQQIKWNEAREKSSRHTNDYSANLSNLMAAVAFEKDTNIHNFTPRSQHYKPTFNFKHFYRNPYSSVL